MLPTPYIPGIATAAAAAGPRDGDEQILTPASVVPLSDVPLEVLSPDRMEEVREAQLEEEEEKQMLAHDNRKAQDEEIKFGYAPSVLTRQMSLQTMLLEAEADEPRLNDGAYHKPAAPLSGVQQLTAANVAALGAIAEEEDKSAAAAAAAAGNAKAGGAEAAKASAGAAEQAAEASAPAAEHHTAAARVQKMFRRQSNAKKKGKPLVGSTPRVFKPMAQLRAEAVQARREREGLAASEASHPAEKAVLRSSLPAVLRTKPPKPASPPSPKKSKTPQPSSRPGQPSQRAQSQRPRPVPPLDMSKEHSTNPQPAAKPSAGKQKMPPPPPVAVEEIVDERPWFHGFLRCLPEALVDPPNALEEEEAALGKARAAYAVAPAPPTKPPALSQSPAAEMYRAPPPVSPLFLDNESVGLASDIQLLTATIEGMHSQVWCEVCGASAVALRSVCVCARARGACVRPLRVCGCCCHAVAYDAFIPRIHPDAFIPNYP